MARLFISHSSMNNAEAIALCDWLSAEGWDDVFLDLDPECVSAWNKDPVSGVIGVQTGPL
jgi:hypothetical protein